ncbi:MAG: histidine phosphatase family protein [Clostridia bacterium]|nr:histidine phosphatase family protein [Clostridia bacterium]
MTTLIVVRHGQSVSNLQKRFTGQHETVLTDLGHLQAENTARFLKDYPIDRIYSSDLTRAMETAQHTAKYLGMEIIPDKGFREINAGLWEGMEYQAIRSTYPEDYEVWLTDLGRAHPTGGESVLQLAARIYYATDRVLTENRGKTVAIFTHATPLRMLGCRWHGLAPEDAMKINGCANASVSIAEYENDGSFRLVLYGYDRHQGENVTELPRGLV